MFRYVVPLAAALAVAGCSGDSFDGSGAPPWFDDPDEPTDPVDPAPGSPEAIPPVLRHNVSQIVYDADADTFQIAIGGLDTTPELATWRREASFDVPGYRAYTVQEDPLDRMFIGLAAASGDGSVRAGVGGDAGQFNYFFSGATYTREGDFTPPPVDLPGPGTGQVSYAGTYAGVTNIRAQRPGDHIAPVPDTIPPVPPEAIPGQASRVSGHVFINANFADNHVNGTVYERVLVDYDFGLENVVLVPADITADGTFFDRTERPLEATGGDHIVTGDYGGIFGGERAGNVAGIVALERLYDRDGNELENAKERGIFVLRQCGMSGDSSICADVAP